MLRLLATCICLSLPIAAGDSREWVKANAIPLKTVEAGHGFEDLQPLKKIVGDARIVSLGEATHGTREIFQLKHRMLEFLVKEMGFTIFSIEASMPEAYRLNGYVLEGKGDPAALLKGMYFWTWDTEEVLAMIRWLREYNLTAKNKVQFTGFDMQTPGVAAGIVEEFVRRRDPELLPVVSAAGKSAGQSRPAGAQFGAFMAAIPAESLAGKKLRMRGSIRTAKVTGEAHLWMRVDGGGKVLTFHNLFLGAVKGDSDWKSVEIVLEVPAGAQSVAFGGTLAGEGTAWYDSLALESDGAPVALGEHLDLGFEADTVKGFGAGSPVYETALDQEVFQSGRQSLRLRRIPDSAAPAGADARAASGEWKKIVERLESSRARYAGQGAEGRDIEWAAQNARVVLQGLQMKTGEVQRDASMARNVRWILEQSPAAKIVLWAHNGHVATASPFYRSMGADLREFYGKGMVVFGFAFNQGAFQAVEIGKVLRSFTVSPAPADSLDGLLASAGAPVLALDLRQAPAELRVPLRSRSIGAAYSEAAGESSAFSAINAPENYDAMLFIDKTSAARATPSMQVLSAAADGSLRDTETGVSVRLPEGWTLQRGSRYGQGEQTILFGHGPDSCGLWYGIQAAPRTAAAVAASLAQGIEEKTGQRLRAGLSGYRVRPESRRTHQVNGHPALTWQAEFTEQGKGMVETLTRVESPTVIALFFSRAPAARPLDIAPLVESLRLPAGQ